MQNLSRMTEAQIDHVVRAIQSFGSRRRLKVGKVTGELYGYADVARFGLRPGPLA